MVRIGEYRTIKLNYILEVSDEVIIDNECSLVLHDEYAAYRQFNPNRSPGNTIIPRYPLKVNVASSLLFFHLHSTATTYVFIKQCENYEFDDNLWVQDQSGEDVEAILLYDKGPTFLHVGSQANPGKVLVIVFNHKIQSSLSGQNNIKSKILSKIPILGWNNIAAALAIFTIILSIIAYKNIQYDAIQSNTNVKIDDIFPIVTLIGVVISLLAVYKGWFFSKNMSSELNNYDIMFQVFIVLLISIMLAIFISYFSQFIL